MKLHLITPYWRLENENRNKELERCEQINATIFEKVTNPNIRATYLDLFNLCKDDCINVIANSDIYFDQTIHLAQKIKEWQCYAITRREGDIIHPKGHWSQDVWIFSGKPKNLQVDTDFHLGIPGCDNRIAYLINKAGYHVMNPVFSIHCFHLHKTQFRTYTKKTKKIEPPYYLERPIHLK